VPSHWSGHRRAADGEKDGNGLLSFGLQIDAAFLGLRADSPERGLA
jgi:hypothetical protein